MLPRTMADSGIVSVKLKRQLHYHGHVTHQTVRPSAVMRGLDYLKQNNDLYGDVTLDTHWEALNEENDGDLWSAINAEGSHELSDETDQNRNELETRSNTGNSLTQENHASSSLRDNAAEVDTSERELSQANVESAEETKAQDEVEDTSSPAVQFDTCLQNADGPSLEYSIAPGEGQRPLSLFKYDNAELQ